MEDIEAARYEKHMLLEIQDRVFCHNLLSGRNYIFRSSKKSGIIGTGVIISNPGVMGIEEEEKKFILSSDKFEDFEIRVDMKIERILPNRLKRETIANRAILADLRTIKAAMSNVFLLSDEQASVLEMLVND